MTVKHIIFDLDGTLANTLYDIMDAVNIALSAYGYEQRTLKQIQYAVGSGTRQLIIRSMPEDIRSDDKVDLVYNRYLEVYSKNYLDRTCAYDGLPEVISKLKKAGIKMAVATNKPDDRAKEVVNKLFGSDAFEVINGQQPGFPVKPDPTLTLLTLKQLGGTAEDTVFIGDSDVDAATAANAGLKEIGVLWGFRTCEEMAKGGKQWYTAKTPQELLKIITENM